MTEAPKVSLRALIVDDEPPARRRLSQLLSDSGKVSDIATARSVKEALQIAGQADIDVVFLDIHMPMNDGFAFVDKVPFEVPIVFVTAYSEFAVRAFEVDAIDYILKPIDATRLDATLKRLEKAMQRSATAAPGVSTPDMPPENGAFLRLQLTKGVRIVSIDTIVCVLARDDYTKVVLRDGSSELVSVSMKRWAEKLPPERFARVHRSAIAATPLIERLKQLGSRWQAYLSGLADPIPVSRSFARRLRAENDF